MSLYDIIMKPFELFFLGRVREYLIAQASGNVLEVATGTGVNLRYYDKQKIINLTCTDIIISRNLILKQSDNVKVIRCSVEDLPFQTESFDSVVATLALCSVDKLDKSLSEIKRVLKPDGKFIFIEHIKPVSITLSRTFDRVNPIWNNITRCNINRETDEVIKKCGFKSVQLNKNENSILCYGIAVK